MQYLKAFLPRSTVYLPADLEQWTSDTEICDVDAGNMPTRSLELCDICVMLGVIDHLLTPERAIETLSWSVEKILISYGSTDFSRQGLEENRANAYSLTEIYAMLEGADFCITEQRQYLRQTLIKAESRRFDGKSSRRREERRASFVVKRSSVRDELRRVMLQVRSLRAALHRI